MADARFVCQADGYEAPEHLLVRYLDGTVLCVACARDGGRVADG